jgi:CheY-like chemotaxis protein
VTRVLVVDDDVHARTVVRAILENAGMEVVEATDGAAGLLAFRDSGADLVLCDLFMPDVDGLEMIRALRGEFPGVKVIAMSAGGFHGTVDLLAVARRLGAAEVLPKPFTSSALVEAVERVLQSPADDSTPGHEGST